MMRIYISIAALALMTNAVMAQPGWFNYQRNTKNYLYWHESNHKLILSSGADDGIQVKQASPSSVWGLHQGDTILAIDNKRVEHVEDMLKLLLSKSPALVTMQVRNKSGEHAIRIASKDYTQIVLPEPPQ